MAIFRAEQEFLAALSFGRLGYPVSLFDPAEVRQWQPDVRLLGKGLSLILNPA